MALNNQNINLYDRDNVFYKIIHKKLPCNLVMENEHVIAFHDINPQAKVHILCIPKKEYVNFDDFMTRASDQEIVVYYRTLQEIIFMYKLKDYKVLANRGSKAGQVVFHFHTHILGY